MTVGAPAREPHVDAGASASVPRATVAGTRLDPLAGVLAVGLGVAFVVIALRVLDVLPHDFDEGWFMLDARLVARGERPFVDFPHHEMPLHLYLLAVCGRVFGETVLGYRMLSLLTLAASGVVLYRLARPFVGAIPALVAEAAFLFSPVQSRALTAVPETPALLLTLVGAVLLFTRDERWAARASGVVFVLALLIKPTYLVMPVAAALSLAYARQWRRLRDFTAAGVLAAAVGLAWVAWSSDGVFLDTVRFQLTKIGTHQGGMWSIDSGFTDMQRSLGIETPRQWAAINFLAFFQSRTSPLPLATFALALLAIPVWLGGCARDRPAMQAFVVLWPAAFALLDFFLVDFTSPRYFIPFGAFTAFFLAGWIWLVGRSAGTWAMTAVAAVAGAALVGHAATTLGSNADLWFWGRMRAIAAEHPRVVSFTPLFFAATSTEPGCGFGNSALTYGSFGENILAAERVRQFQFGDDRLIACLRADPGLSVVIDWAFYFFTRPGSRLRAYLAGEGSAQRVFFSPDAVQQWDRPLLRMNPFR
jgi:4-amino-4-deoxy-L-arabinose transferase-like glycosyltransferase